MSATPIAPSCWGCHTAGRAEGFAGIVSQREAGAALADETAALHEEREANAANLSERERAGHRAIAVAMRSLAAKIRGGA